MSEAKEATLKVLLDIRDAWGFDPLDEPEASALYPLIADGSLTFDPKTCACEYRLKKPLTLKNDGKLEVVTFREPSGLELEYIRAGALVGTDEKVDLGSLVTMTIRALIKTGDLSVGLADRISGRDVDTLRGVLTELGFFGR